MPRYQDASPEREVIVRSSKRRIRTPSPARSRSHTYSPSPQREVVSSRRREISNGGGYERSGYERNGGGYDRGYGRDAPRGYDRRRSPGFDRRPAPSYGGGGFRGGYGGGPPRGRGGFDGRDNPDPCPCLGVFGMSLHTNERDLKSLFGKYGEVESVQIVYDRLSGRSRGFGFVYFASTKDATRAKDHMTDVIIDGMKVRVDYSVTRSGGPSRHALSDDRNGDRSRSRSRSPSPVYEKEKKSSRRKHRDPSRSPR